MASDPAQPEESSSRAPWGAMLRNVGLALLLLAIAWMAFNVRLPSVGELQTAIDGLGWGGWLAFTALYSIVAITPIPVTIMAVTGGLLFGLTIGSVLSVSGVMAGCWAAYWIARALGKNTVKKLLGRHGPVVESHLDRAGFEAVCALRLMPGVPYWPVNYGGGAFGVKHRDFLLASLLSSIPGQISLVAIGAFIAEPSVWTALPVLIAWAAVIALTVLAYRRWRHTHRGSAGA